MAVRMGKGSKLQVRLPFAIDNKIWLRAGKRSIPGWLPDEKRWEIPKSWFNDFVNRALQRYRRVYVVQPYHEHEVCAPACWNAVRWTAASRLPFADRQVNHLSGHRKDHMIM